MKKPNESHNHKNNYQNLKPKLTYQQLAWLKFMTKSQSKGL